MSLFTGRIRKAEAEAKAIRDPISAIKAGVGLDGSDNRNVRGIATLIQGDNLRLARKESEISNFGI